jgi:hypothetical protein
MVDALALKVAELEPDEIDTLAGTFNRLLLDVSDTVVADDAAFVRVTVHTDEPPEPRVAGLHTKVESCAGDWEIVILPPVPDAGIVLPSAAAAKAPLNWMGTLEWLTVDVRRTVTAAMFPGDMTPKLRPEAMQVVVEPLLPQVIVLPDALKPELAATDTLATSAAK